MSQHVEKKKNQLAQECVSDQDRALNPEKVNLWLRHHHFF